MLGPAILFIPPLGKFVLGYPYIWPMFCMCFCLSVHVDPFRQISTVSETKPFVLAQQQIMATNTARIRIDASFASNDERDLLFALPRSWRRCYKLLYLSIYLSLYPHLCVFISTSPALLLLLFLFLLLFHHMHKHTVILLNHRLRNAPCALWTPYYVSFTRPSLCTLKSTIQTDHAEGNDACTIAVIV